MAETKNKRPRAATKDRVQNFEAVMAGLLMPLPDAELEDRDLAKLEARAKRAAKKRAEEKWHLAWLRQEHARHAYDSVETLRLIAAYYPDEGSAPHSDDLQQYRTRWWQTVDAMMRIPAPHLSGLRWKQKHARMVKVWGPAALREPPNPEWARLIAADEARLTRSREAPAT